MKPVQAYGHLLVNKVAGNFHFAPGKSFVAHHVHIHDLGSLGKGQYIKLIMHHAHIHDLGSLGKGSLISHLPTSFNIP